MVSTSDAFAVYHCITPDAVLTTDRTDASTNSCALLSARVPRCVLHERAVAQQLWRPGTVARSGIDARPVNPAVAQDTIASTICARGWTRTIRPSQSHTQALKRQGIAAYGYTDKDPRDYQEDHLIPLELGGDAADPHNLWPQPRFTSDGWDAEAKDRLERRLHLLVCRGMVSLAVAQRAIAIDWVGAYRRYVAPGDRYVLRSFSRSE
jgi:hypothetical protein